MAIYVVCMGKNLEIKAIWESLDSGCGLSELVLPEDWGAVMLTLDIGVEGGEGYNTFYLNVYTLEYLASTGKPLVGLNSLVVPTSDIEVLRRAISEIVSRCDAGDFLQSWPRLEQVFWTEYSRDPWWRTPDGKRRPEFLEVGGTAS
jgi:hypothetical protein